MANCAFYLQDSVGDTFLYTVAADTYEGCFREHANWWKGYMRSSRRVLRHDGTPARKPVFPVTVVIDRLDGAEQGL